jgi:hypothetical protein
MTPEEFVEAKLRGAGTVRANTVLAAGRLAGFREKDLMAAHRRLGVVAIHGARGFWWRYPHPRPSAAGGEALQQETI